MESIWTPELVSSITKSFYDEDPRRRRQPRFPSQDIFFLWNMTTLREKCDDSCTDVLFLSQAMLINELETSGIRRNLLQRGFPSDTMRSTAKNKKKSLLRKKKFKKSAGDERAFKANCFILRLSSSVIYNVLIMLRLSSHCSIVRNLWCRGNNNYEISARLPFIWREFSHPSAAAVLLSFYRERSLLSVALQNGTKTS